VEAPTIDLLAGLRASEGLEQGRSAPMAGPMNRVPPSGDGPPVAPWGQLQAALLADDGAGARAMAWAYDPLSSASRAALAAALDRVHDEMLGEQDLETIAVAGSAAIGTGLSVGYVLWLARGGVLVASLMSSVPAWASVDPLPVLAQMRRDEDGEDADREVDPIEGLFERARRLVRGGPTDRPAPEAAGLRAATPEEGA
jgi:hypothetical protein